MLNFFKFPKNDRYFYWTDHAKNKMMYYRLTEQKIKSILKSSARIEEGIAPETVAVMIRNDKPKRKEEIWVMSQMVDYKGKKDFGKKKAKRMVVISAWRYPGISKNKEVPIPDEILEEIKNFKVDQLDFYRN